MMLSLAARDVPSLQKKEYGMVEVPQPPATACWQKSSVSASGGCAEVARSQEHVWVRDSKNLRGPALGFTRGGWAAFLVGLRCDEFGHSERSG